MSRTFRRVHARHEYRWVLCDHVFNGHFFEQIRVCPHAETGRRLLARFHADRGRSGPNRAFRRHHNRLLDTANDAALRRAVRNSDYDAVFQARHRHSAQWAWW